MDKEVAEVVERAADRVRNEPERVREGLRCASGGGGARGRGAGGGRGRPKGVLQDADEELDEQRRGDCCHARARYGALLVECAVGE